MDASGRRLRRFGWLLTLAGAVLCGCVVAAAVGVGNFRLDRAAAPGLMWAFALMTSLGGGLLVFTGVLLLGRLGPTQLALARREQELAVRRSEERLQLAVAGSNDALFDYDPAEGRVYLSDVFRQWMGIGRSDARSVVLDPREITSWIRQEYVDRVREAFAICAENGRGFDVEFEVNRPDGGRFWVQARGRGVPQGPGYRVSGFASDISHRKVAERLLRDTVDRLGAVLDNIAEGIVTLNQAGEVCAVNAAALQMFALDREAFVGRPLVGLLELPDDTGGWASLADRQPREGRGMPREGTPFPAEFTVSTMEVRSDERYIVVLRDISERKVAEDRLRRAMAETQAATRAKDDFLATMSHEIRTPMNGVLGMTRLLLDMELSTEQRETAELIRSSGESLLTIINDILDFSRAGSGHLKVDSVAFDLRETIREVAELLGRRHSAVDLYVDYPPELPGRLRGDPGRIRQVLMNLVGNALKFTQQGHVALTVSPVRDAGHHGGDPASLEIAVEDTGPGIPDDVGDLMFEPFTQADASTTRRFGGTGLGLAISRRLVELMGGEIGFDSVPGAGATFRFTLNLPVLSTEPPRQWPELAGRRVLVVNDDPRGRELLERCLTRAGVVCELAASGADALVELEAARFDLALVDDRMPDMDGVLLSELIRIDGHWRDMKLVLFCGGSVRGAEAAQVDYCLVRPVMPEYLLQTVAGLMGRERTGAGTSADLSDAEEPTAEGENAPGVRLAARRGGSEPPRDAPPAGARPARVLLVEDNPVNQKVAVRMLEKAGCRIDVAADGAEALKMWRHFDYDLVLMDCQMPELDGLEATRQIRLEELDSHRQRTPIVAMTANAMVQDRTDCLAAGMDDYLSKPVVPDDLYRVLHLWAPHARLFDKAVG